MNGNVCKSQLKIDLTNNSSSNVTIKLFDGTSANNYPYKQFVWTLPYVTDYNGYTYVITINGATSTATFSSATTLTQFAAALTALGYGTFTGSTDGSTYNKLTIYSNDYNFTTLTLIHAGTAVSYSPVVVVTSYYWNWPNPHHPEPYTSDYNGYSWQFYINGNPYNGIFSSPTTISQAAAVFTALGFGTFTATTDGSTYNRFTINSPTGVFNQMSLQVAPITFVASPWITRTYTYTLPYITDYNGYSYSVVINGSTAGHTGTFSSATTIVQFASAITALGHGTCVGSTDGATYNQLQVTTLNTTFGTLALTPTLTTSYTQTITTTWGQNNVTISGSQDYSTILNAFTTGLYAMAGISQIYSASTAQLSGGFASNILTLKGDGSTRTIYPILDPNQKQTVLEDLPGYMLPLNRLNNLEFTLLANTSVSLLFDLVASNTGISCESSAIIPQKVPRPIHYVKSNREAGQWYFNAEGKEEKKMDQQRQRQLTDILKLIF